MAETSNPETPVGLETRNIFLDTEVFRSYGHNVNAEPMKVLGQYVEDGVFVLHTTDVTLREVSRQLIGMETKLTTSANRVANELRRWNSRYRLDQRRLPVPNRLSGPTQPSGAYRDFEWTVRHEWHAREHRAADLSIGLVLDRYFASQAPFDTQDSKEFPDAFALLALENWCSGTQQRIYVVSNDKGVLRAAAESEHLIGVRSLDRLFSLVALAEGHEVAEAVSTAFEKPSLVSKIQESLSENVGWVGWLYGGDRDDGEVIDVEILELQDVEDVTILRVEQEQVACVAHVRLLVSAEINYMDFSEAIWDREDQRYFGGRPVVTEVEESVGAKIFVELARDGDTLTLSSSQFFTRDLVVTDSLNHDYLSY